MKKKIYLLLLLLLLVGCEVDGRTVDEIYIVEIEWHKYVIYDGYFKDVNIVDGLCRMDGITFVFTKVEIEERPKKED